MNKTIPGDLPALWRERAETLSSYGDPNSARLWLIAAVELERALALVAGETLTLREAARECGYTMCPPGYPTVWCSVALHKSGRMVVKAFTGGWEQTSSITVQCLVHPADSILNDSTNDFNVREGLLAALEASNPDSAPDAGWNASNPRGWRQEVGGTIWQLPNGGGFKFVQQLDPNATACAFTFDLQSLLPENAPVPGATLVGVAHSHPNWPLLEEMFGCRGTMKINGVEVPKARFPGDTTVTGELRPVPVKEWEDSTNAGSDADWTSIYWLQVPEYIISKMGLVFKLNPPPTETGPFVRQTYRAFGGSVAQRKCNWPKKSST